MRPSLCEEALRRGRILAGLMPGGAEVHGILALMEIQASRLGARTGPQGEPILLLDQDRRRWDRLLIRRGLTALDKAEALGGGPYTIQAAIAACHARATRPEDTDWTRIATLYQVLAYVSPSPVVELNRAVAVGMSSGPAAGLAIVDALRAERALGGYPQLPAVRGDLLAKLGRADEARQEVERAAAPTPNQRGPSPFPDPAAPRGSVGPAVTRPPPPRAAPALGGQGADRAGGGHLGGGGQSPPGHRLHPRGIRPAGRHEERRRDADQFALLRLDGALPVDIRTGRLDRVAQLLQYRA